MSDKKIQGKRTCGTCEFSRRDGDRLECTRHAPTIMDSNGFGVFPTVGLGWSCVTKFPEHINEQFEHLEYEIGKAGECVAECDPKSATYAAFLIGKSEVRIDLIKELLKQEFAK